MQNFPGYELIEQGLKDISQNKSSIYSALLFSAKTRLGSLGVAVGGIAPADPSMELYRLLDIEFGDGAHSKFNALNRRLISFMKSMEKDQSYA